MTGLSIVGLICQQRAEHAPQLQEVLTRHGSMILSRMGVRSPDKNEGIITLVVEGSESDISGLVRDVGQVDGVRVNHLTLR